MDNENPFTGIAVVLIVALSVWAYRSDDETWAQVMVVMIVVAIALGILALLVNLFASVVGAVARALKNILG